MTNQREVLVEELSCERALVSLLPRIVPGTEFNIRTFNGKPDLLRKLPQRLAGYARWASSAGIKIVVVVDRDDDDCVALKAEVERLVLAAGLVTLTRRSPGQVADACTRVVVEELEAWSFGDVPALTRAYPRVPASLESRRAYRDPDAVRGGTAEALERVLRDGGYGETLAKVDTASLIAPRMDVEVNRSASFQVFRDGVRRLAAEERAS